MNNYHNTADEPASVYDYRELARQRLPRQLFDFIDGGSYNETTIKKNQEDFNKILLHKRIMKDVSQISTQTEILGQKLNLPLILAPVGFSGVYARRGEVQAAKAAEKAGVPFCLSTVGICSIEEICEKTRAPFWFQLYMIKDRGYCKELLQRAHDAGCPVLLFTVDLPVVGLRYRDIRNRLAGNGAPVMARPPKILEFLSHPRWFYDVVLRGRPLAFGNLMGAMPGIRKLAQARQWVDSRLDASLTWKDLEWVRANWPGKLVLKGVLDPDDASEAAKRGADGIVVSNHAGRHLDSTPSTISVLPALVEAAGSRLEILLDGGIFNSLDIIKALALGAKGCMIGRAWAYALAARGEQGVSHVIKILQREFEVAMAHLGITKIQDIDRNTISSYR